MKLLANSVLALLATSCSQYDTQAAVYVMTYDQEEKVKFASEDACHLIQIIQHSHHENWKATIQKIQNTYTRVIKNLDDKEVNQFTIVFFGALSKSEDLDLQSLDLLNANSTLPNTDSLMFLYRSEKELDTIIELVNHCTDSTNKEIKYCASAAKSYFECQKNLFIAVREVDYRNLQKCDIPERIPPEILRANAKLLEQRDHMSRLVIEFYENFADAKHCR